MTEGRLKCRIKLCHKSHNGHIQASRSRKAQWNLEECNEKISYHSTQLPGTAQCVLPIQESQPSQIKPTRFSPRLTLTSISNGRAVFPLPPKVSYRCVGDTTDRKRLDPSPTAAPLPNADSWTSTASRNNKTGGTVPPANWAPTGEYRPVAGRWTHKISGFGEMSPQFVGASRRRSGVASLPSEKMSNIADAFLTCSHYHRASHDTTILFLAARTQRKVHTACLMRPTQPAGLSPESQGFGPGVNLH